MAREENTPRKRCMLYNQTGSQIFEGEAEIEAAQKAGWKDKPVKVAQTPQAGDENAAAQILELNKALVSMDQELKAAKSAREEAQDQIADLNAALSAAEERANAAEAENKKLAAALKKATPSDSK